VSLGKPRQEIWCARYAAASGAKVCLAFGAAPDFIAGTVSRAPEVLRASGLEWLYRLWLEPRRLARRYLLQGPPALFHLLRDRPA
jgi:exopolysaccharide biosynthesis WecB/TagA/CpsF family protein